MYIAKDAMILRGREKRKSPHHELTLELAGRNSGVGIVYLGTCNRFETNSNIRKDSDSKIHVCYNRNPSMLKSWS